MAVRKKTRWTLDSQGDYSIQAGWKQNPDGKYVQHKFRLGSDLDAAKVRANHLQAFWKRIEEEDFGPASAVWIDWGNGPVFTGPERATWTEWTLEIAKQIAKGTTQFVIGREPSESEQSYVRSLHRLQRRYPMLTIIADDEDVYLNGKRKIIDRLDAENEARRRIQFRNGELAESPLASRNSGTLYQAFDAYIADVRKAKLDVPDPKAYGRTRIKNAARLKERHADVPLSSIRFDEMQAMIDYWKNRPLVKRRGTPIRRKTAVHHISELMRFFKWLNRTDKFDWRLPDEFDQLERQVPETTAEIQAKETPAQVKTYSLDHLYLLYEYATPLERAIMLLALNCGFGAAEQGTLLLRQIVLAQSHPMATEYDFDSSPNDCFIKRIRVKNKVYGEHLLWRHTVQGVKWVIERRQAQGDARADSFLFVTDKLEPFAKATRGGNEGQRFANIWGGLIARVRKDYPDFPKLSFGKLRKTAGNLIRRFADGEVAGVFLCHGKPVKTDDLSEVYSNRTFGKVFTAIKLVEEHLGQMFAAVDDPFGKYRQQYTSRKVVKKIVELFDSGTPVARIASELGVSRSTIYRHLESHGRPTKRQKADMVKSNQMKLTQLGTILIHPTV